MGTMHYKTSDKKVSCVDGEDTNLLRSSIRYEMGVPYKCGGGFCGTCKVFIEEGAENLTEIKKAEIKHLEEKVHQGYRLACQTFTRGDVTITWDPSVQTQENKKLREFWEKQPG